jgi:3-oxoacyl-[acyl-carrier protein] reductase
VASELAGRVALVTGGGRGIGRGIAEELARAGMRVAVAARSGQEVAETAEAIGGLAVTLDVTDRGAVEEAVERVERELGPIDLLCANAGTMIREEGRSWDADVDGWWRVFEVNVLGVHLCCRAVVPGMIERGSGRIVITGSGASYLPGLSDTAYSASKAAVGRYGENLARQLEPQGIPVFVISPGLVRTEMTSSANFPDDAPWTPPECAPRLVLALAEGRLDRLSGRYIHAEHDDPEELAGRIDEVLAGDLNAIRLRR